MSSRLKLLIGVAVAVVLLGVVALLIPVQKRSANPTTTPSADMPSSTLPSSPSGTAESPQGNAPVGISASSDSGVSLPSQTADASLQTFDLQPQTSFRSMTSIIELPLDASDADVRDAFAGTAKMVAERFGTFSTQNDFQNLRDLQPFMTDSLAHWLDGYIERETAKRNLTAPVSGTSTIALRSELKAFDAAGGTATVNVDTSRTDTGGEKPKTYAQGFEVKFFRDGSSWKIDNVRWVR